MIGHDGTRPVGQIFRVRHWDHCTKNVSITYSVGRAKHVMIMACLGEEPLDGSQELDLEKALNSLGWFRKKG